MPGPHSAGRRSFLATLGVAALTAGCLSDGPIGSRAADGSPPSDPGTTAATQSATDPGASTRTLGSTFPGGESVDAFESFDADWTVDAGTVSLAEGTYDDLPAVELDSAGGNRARITRPYHDPRDFTEWDLSIAARLDSTSREVVQVGVGLVDVHGERRRLSGAILSSATDRWVRLDLGIDEDTGADVGAIAELRIDHWAGDAESTFAVADLRRHPQPETGYVMFTFDDGPKEDYTIAYDVLSRFDFSGTAFPHTKTITGSRGPSVEQYHEMMADGWDVGGHTRAHSRLPDFSRSEQRAILEENRTFLEEHDLTPEVFRTPYGAYDTDTLDLMAEVFDLSIVGNGSATGTNLQLSDPTTLAFDPGDDYERAKDFIDTAVEYNRLLGLTIHMARMDSRSAFETIFEHAHEYVQAGDLEVITPTQLLAMQE